MVRVFKIDAANQNAFPKCLCGTSLPQPEGFFRKSEGVFRESETWCSFAYVSSASHLDLLRLRLGLSHLHLSRNFEPATEGFPNRSFNFKDAYHSYIESPGSEMKLLLFTLRLRSCSNHRLLLTLPMRGRSSSTHCVCLCVCLLPL